MKVVNNEHKRNACFPEGRPLAMFPLTILAITLQIKPVPVRTTSILIVLGVGSFVCYKLFHRIRNRLLPKDQVSQIVYWKNPKFSDPITQFVQLELKSEDEFSLASYFEDDFDLESYNSLFGDSESSEESELAMGLASSSNNIPVYFSKTNGIRFQQDFQSNSIAIPSNPTHNTPVGSHKKYPNQNNNNKHFRTFCEGDDEFNDSPIDNDNFSICESLSYDENVWSQDAVSMMGNFSPSSLKEKYFKAGFPITQNSDDCSMISEGPSCISREMSIDSEMSELFMDVQNNDLQTVAKFENLHTDIKQLLEELSAELDDLQVHQQSKPSFGYHITDISEYDSSEHSAGSSVVGIVQLHKAKIKAQGLMEEENEDSDSMRLISSISLPWDPQVPGKIKQEVPLCPKHVSNQSNNAKSPNNDDSGSEFGNSLESESGDLEPNSKSATDPLSLEWDPMCLPQSETDGGAPLNSSRSKHSPTKSPLAQQIKQVISKSPITRLAPLSLDSVEMPSPSTESLSSKIADVESDIKNDTNGNEIDSGVAASYRGDKPNIGELINIDLFVKHSSAQTKHIYQHIANSSGYQAVQIIKPDHLSVFRAILYHLWSQGHSLLNMYGESKNLIKNFERTLKDQPWLLKWSCSSNSTDCIEFLKERIESMSKVEGLIFNKECDIKNYLNDPESNKMLQIMKLMVILAAIELYDKVKNNQVAPLFALVMFARNSSKDPRSLFSNHLDAVGEQQPSIQQIDLFLLSHALFFKLNIYRVHRYRTEEFLSYYSESSETNRPVVTLVTENDLHFHALAS